MTHWCTYCDAPLTRGEFAASRLAAPHDRPMTPEYNTCRAVA